MYRCMALYVGCLLYACVCVFVCCVCVVCLLVCVSVVCCSLKIVFEWYVSFECCVCACCLLCVLFECLLAIGVSVSPLLGTFSCLKLHSFSQGGVSMYSLTAATSQGKGTQGFLPVCDHASPPSVGAATECGIPSSSWWPRFPGDSIWEPAAGFEHPAGEETVLGKLPGRGPWECGRTARGSRRSRGCVRGPSARAPRVRAIDGQACLLD